MGEWKTIRGAKVYIKDGQSFEDAIASRRETMDNLNRDFMGRQKNKDYDKYQEQKMLENAVKKEMNKTKTSNIQESLKIQGGDRVEYERQFEFGKTGQEKAKVVMVRNGIALLDNGDQQPLTALKKKK